MPSGISKITGKNSFWGQKHSEISRKRMRLSHIGKKYTEKRKQNMSLAHKGKKLSEETKRKLSKIHKGKILSEEAKKKISRANKGKIPWNKGKKDIYSEETKIKMGRTLKGIKRSKEFCKKNSEGHKGIKSYLWKGGITPENRKIRNSIEFRLWRESVFARDNWTCQKCKINGGYLHPHHIFNFATYLDLRFAIDNGMTFCKVCHNRFHKIYGNKNNTKKQVEEFLIS